MSLIESTLHPEAAVFRHVIPAGEPYLFEVKAGQTLRLHDLVRVLPGETIQRSYWISTRRELHKSVRLRVVWDFLLELCREEQGVLLED